MPRLLASQSAHSCCQNSVPERQDLTTHLAAPIDDHVAHLVTADHASFSGWHAALQLFKPVEYDIDLRRCRVPLRAGLEHQEALAATRRSWGTLPERAGTVLSDSNPGNRLYWVD